MNVREAAIRILQEAGEPLRPEEISKRILAKGLWQSHGKTPIATVGARLYSDIKKLKEVSPFVRVDPQTFGLRDATAGPSVVESPPKAKSGTEREESSAKA